MEHLRADDVNVVADDAWEALPRARTYCQNAKLYGDASIAMPRRHRRYRWLA